MDRQGRETSAGERLYNGIVLPQSWPPEDMGSYGEAPQPVPYLDKGPDVIDISVGRQLFVDDFLIAQTDMEREYHRPRKYEGNPVLTPEVPTELGQREVELKIIDIPLPTAAPFHGGVWYDAKERLLKLWYKAGFFGSVALAVSKDGLNWERRELDAVPGTNLVLPLRTDWQQDSNAVVYDPYTGDETQRYKMFIYNNVDHSGYVFTSPDGVHWSDAVKTGLVGDCSTIFYNPFRKKWVYSIRADWHERSRNYSECDDLIDGAGFSDPVKWLRADELDARDPEIQMKPELYNFNAVAYESILLGTYNIYLGIHEDAQAGDVKYNDIHLGYSRDGFHFYRPSEDRTPFLRASRTVGDWERGYLHDNAAICVVNGDELWFYYAGFQGNGKQGWFDMHSYASTGLAILRRDGFASMNAGAEEKALTTKALTFQGKYLFVNAEAAGGELKAELLDEEGRPIEGFGLEDCIPVAEDSTKVQVAWRGGKDLSAFAGRPVRFRFAMQNGRLYAFWVSGDEKGASGGYLAGGSVGQDGLVDTPQSYLRD